jgi:N6-L-threonylcarbamoyladenine synthase
LLAAGTPAANVARAVEQCLANTLERILRRAIEETGIKEVLVVGGVAANRYLRQRLRHRLQHRAVGASLHFAAPEHSSDNAIGIALLAREAAMTGQGSNDT